MASKGTIFVLNAMSGEGETFTVDGYGEPYVHCVTGRVPS